MSQQPDPAPRPRARNRVPDAARLLPFLGLALLVLPAVLLPTGAPRATVGHLAWLFGAWALLLLLTFLVSRWHRRAEDAGE